MSTFKCHICGHNLLSTESEYFQHIYQHLKKKETVTCVFQNCDYKTNIYENFKSHKYRKHSGREDTFKPGIISVEESFIGVASDVSEEEIIEHNVPLTSDLDKGDSENLEKDIELKIASVLLKLEHIFLVPNAAVDELLQELNYLLGSVSRPITKKNIIQILRDSGCQFDQLVVEKLAITLCETNPLKKAIGENGPLSSSWRRKTYYKSHFNVVEPVEYILDRENHKSFQYVSILKS